MLFYEFFNSFLWVAAVKISDISYKNSQSKFNREKAENTSVMLT